MSKRADILVGIAQAIWEIATDGTSNVPRASSTMLKKGAPAKAAQDLADLYEDINDKSVETMFAAQRKRTESAEVFGYELARGAIESSSMMRSLQAVGILVPTFRVSYNKNENELAWEGDLEEDESTPVFDVEGFPRTGHRLVKPNTVEEDLGIENPTPNPWIVSDYHDRAYFKDARGIARTSERSRAHQFFHYEQAEQLARGTGGKSRVIGVNPAGIENPSESRREERRLVKAFREHGTLQEMDIKELLNVAKTSPLPERYQRLLTDMQDAGVIRKIPRDPRYPGRGFTWIEPIANPAGQFTAKGERMYEDIKAGYEEKGDPRAAEIASRTVYARAADGVPGLLARHGKPPGVPNGRGERQEIVDGMIDRFKGAGATDPEAMARDLARDYENANRNELGRGLISIRRALMGCKAGDYDMSEYPPYSFGAVLVELATSKQYRNSWSRALDGKLRIPILDLNRR